MTAAVPGDQVRGAVRRQERVLLLLLLVVFSR